MTIARCSLLLGLLALACVVPASAEAIYASFLDAEKHSAMTGGEATVEADGSFTALGGYITGRTLETETNVRIVQQWRTSQFPAEAPDSRLEIELSSEEAGTRVTFKHSNIPEGQGASYEKGWTNHYLDPMCAWFENQGD